FGILTKYQVRDRAVPWIAVAAPVICLIINSVGKKFLGFDLGFTLLIVNGLLTFFGMWLFRVKTR
ncbi:MAG TPA: sodium:solute symporter, partial [Bacteroidales bacterium]|nr:sodium:solute symporter [Bacteroidales bacterium]